MSEVISRLIQRAIQSRDPIFKHYRTAKYGNITLCIIPSIAKNTWRIGAAMCSPKDQLNKKDGREISATRCLICEAPESTKVQASRKELLLTIKKQLIAGELSFFEVDGTELCPKWYDEFPRKYKERQQELFSDLN